MVGSASVVTGGEPLCKQVETGGGECPCLKHTYKVGVLASARVYTRTGKINPPGGGRGRVRGMGRVRGV